MEQIKVTRRTTVGFGYTTACENDERGNLRVCQTEAPCHIGAIRKVEEAIDADRTFQSITNGSGTFYTTAWFIRVKGVWRKVSKNQYYHPAMLLNVSDLDSEEFFGYDHLYIDVE